MLLVAPTLDMRYLERDGKTVRVDVEAPDPLVRFAEWLRDADIPAVHITSLSVRLVPLVSDLPEEEQLLVDLLPTVIGLLFATVLDYSIQTVQYLSASGQGCGFGNAEATITSN